MQKKEIEKIYIKKINELKKHNKAYFEDDNPLISDKKYDEQMRFWMFFRENLNLPRFWRIYPAFREKRGKFKILR